MEPSISKGSEAFPSSRKTANQPILPFTDPSWPDIEIPTANSIPSPKQEDDQLESLYPEEMDCPSCGEEGNRGTMYQGFCLSCGDKIEEIYKYFHHGTPFEVRWSTKSKIVPLVPSINTITEEEQYRIWMPNLIGIDQKAQILKSLGGYPDIFFPQKLRFHKKQWEHSYQQRERLKKLREGPQTEKLQAMIVRLLVHLQQWNKNQKEVMRKVMHLIEQRKAIKEHQPYPFKILSSGPPHYLPSFPPLPLDEIIAGNKAFSLLMATNKTQVFQDIIQKNTADYYVYDFEKLLNMYMLLLFLVKPTMLYSPYLAYIEDQKKSALQNARENKQYDEEEIISKKYDEQLHTTKILIEKIIEYRNKIFQFS